MNPTKGMSKEELLEEIDQRKITAFDDQMAMSRWTQQQLSLSGYKHPSDVIRAAHKMNMARIKDWEKNNG